MGEQNLQSRTIARSNGNLILSYGIHVIALAILICFTIPTAAQVLLLDISPQPATPDEEIELVAGLPIQSCFNELTDFTISREGTSVAVDFIVEEVAPAPICVTPPPILLRANLGRFETGMYELQITGVLPEDPFEPVSTEFEVLLGNSATAVPTLSPTALLMMLTIIAIAGAISLRRTRKAALQERACTPTARSRH